MKTSFTFKNMDSSDIIKNHTEQQLQKVYKLLEFEPSPIFIDVVFEPSKIHEHHRVDARLKSPNYEIQAHYEWQGTDFYQTINKTIDRLYHELQEAHRRRIDHLKEVGRHEEFKKQR